MPKYSFDASKIKHALGVAKIVKPIDNDIFLRFSGSSAIFTSSDRRHKSFCRVEATSSDAESDYSTDDFAVSYDRKSLFESDCDTYSFTINDATIKIKAKGDTLSKQATLKKRTSAKRRKFIGFPKFNAPSVVDASMLEKVLSYLSASGMVKETKTEEDMRINQVHFYPEEKSVYASARFHASVVTVPGLSLDLSLISSDIPLIRAFCAKSKKQEIKIQEDKRHTHFSSSGSQSLTVSRIDVKKPPLSIPDPGGYTYHASIDYDYLKQSLNWVDVAMDGTQRLGLEISDGRMRTFQGKEELSNVPTEVDGEGFKADFPARILKALVGDLNAKKINIDYCHEDSSSLMSLSQDEDITGDQQLRVIHVLQSMKEKP
jgi:hypothetical protein